MAPCALFPGAASGSDRLVDCANGRSYFLFTGKVAYATASASCKALTCPGCGQGYLVSYNSYDEQLMVETHFRTSGVQLTGQALYWLGLRGTGAWWVRARSAAPRGAVP